jgi:hypothetical protein
VGGIISYENIANKTAQMENNSQKIMSRDDFMEFFRDDDLLNQLSVDDRIEVFSTILLGSTDITKSLLDRLLIDYCVSNLEIVEIYE